MVWEITRIERKAPPASLFDVPPPGYRKTDYALGGLSPEQQKAIDDAKAKMLENMTPSSARRTRTPCASTASRRRNPRTPRGERCARVPFSSRSA
jgi:hypothetical protein